MIVAIWTSAFVFIMLFSLGVYLQIRDMPTAKKVEVNNRPPKDPPVEIPSSTLEQETILYARIGKMFVERIHSSAEFKGILSSIDFEHDPSSKPNNVIRINDVKSFQRNKIGSEQGVVNDSRIQK